MKRSFLPCLLLGLLLCAPTLLADQPDDTKATSAGTNSTRGMTMRITQEINLGDLSSTTDYRAKFLPPHNFRIEGTMHFTTMEMDLKMVIVGNRRQIRQLSETPLGPKAVVLDLERIWKAIPEYAPSRTFDPGAFTEMLEATRDKKTVPGLKLDGVATEGYEFELPAGRLSLSSNLSLGLPDPARVRIWVCPDDGIARKVEFEDANGAVFLKTLYTEVKTGVRMPEDVFDLTFPPGVPPMDVTEFILGSVAATRLPDAPAQEEKEENHD